ncbi:alpha/beta hydrolase [Dictyobacter sp. S3.2.2.5]|uniref:Alpha/beta hydrolase n=1 Tax=Dictyobacter halimunensis TaxID=3026934 RepID=A0ABQ6FWT9_9CHLR|nr:alpha/beta hydrolase [Dictyobacter sp. S3.2.2.5]
MSGSPIPYVTGSTTSLDGTTIGYRQVGDAGPGLLILPAGTQAAQHCMRLAAALVDTFTVYVVDRRGRGLSGPHGDDYCMARECEDVDALIKKTGAHFVFGHSSSALVTLQAALTVPDVYKVAIYEPPLSTHGSISTGWIPKFDREIAKGKSAAAMTTFLKDDHLTRLPRWLLIFLFNWYIKRDKKTLSPGDVSLEALIPTQRFDGLLVKEMDGSLETFAHLDKDVLLLGGAKSPQFLHDILDSLNHTLPRARWIEYPDYDHSAPNHRLPSQTGPERIAKDLKTFFSQNRSYPRFIEGT